MFDRRTACAGILCAATAAPVQARIAAPRALRAPDPHLWTPPPRTAETHSYAVGPNGRVYVRKFGSDRRRNPIVMLHGGPAGAHDYLLPYSHLATDRRVVFYDQSGCGRSAAPADLSRYTISRYVEELEAVRQHLAAPKVLLIGHSWGGTLAQAYVDRHPDRVEALLLSGSVVRWADFTAAADRWLRELGPDAVAIVRRAEATKRTDKPAYGELLQQYYGLHLCRLKDWPDFLVEAGNAISRNPVYIHMNGPSEFQLTGTLRTSDTSAEARRIRVPAMVICGEYDEAAPWVAKRLADRIPHARFVAFSGLSHMHHIEDPARVIRAARSFLRTLA